MMFDGIRVAVGYRITPEAYFHVLGRARQALVRLASPRLDPLEREKLSPNASTSTHTPT